MDATSNIVFPEAQVSLTQRSIARAWRLHYASIQRSQGRVLVRVIYPSQLMAKSPVLIGTFTSAEWRQIVPMSYSIRERCYVKELWMSAADLFQVYSHSQSVPLSDFLHSQYHQVNGEICLLPAQTSFQYRSFLSFFARKRRRSQLFRFQAAASVMPKSGKLLEDAHFLDAAMVGVADGVGGWRALGVDSGLFAAELMQECKKQTLSSWSLALSPPIGVGSYLIPVAEEALKGVNACGSATLLLCALHTGLLEVLNLGDSRAILVRFHENTPEIVLSTRPMQHSFNTPYQLCKPLTSHHKTSQFPHYSPEITKHLAANLRIRKVISDPVSVANVYRLNVEVGDLLIVGSDGLWDNLFDHETLTYIGVNGSAEEIARKLTKAAFVKSVGKEKTPFEVETHLAYGPSVWKGGKEDDITVIAAWIREEPLQP